MTAAGFSVAGRRLGLLALSAAIHAATAGLVIVALSREVALPPLLVDLAAVERAGSVGEEAGPGRPPGPPGPSALPQGERSGSTTLGSAGRGDRRDLGGAAPTATIGASRGARDASAGREAQNGATPEASLEVSLVREEPSPRRAPPAPADRPVAAQVEALTGPEATAEEALFKPDDGKATGAGAGPGSGTSPGGAAATAGTAGTSGGAGGSRGGATGGEAGIGRGRGLVASAGREAPVPAEYGAYLVSFRRRVEEALRYPLAARRRGISGTVELEVLIDRTGSVSSVEVVASSSHGMLDEAAVEAVREISPQPFPAGVAPRLLRVRLPLVFDLR